MGTAACKAAPPPVTLGSTVTVSTPSGRGVAPTLAIGPDGQRALAWVEVSSDEHRGALSVRIDSSNVVTIVDSLGSVQAHAEAPPQIAFGSGKTVHVLYVVTKDVGKRFPVSALRAVSSNDLGVTWTNPVTVTDDSLVFGSHNFHSLHAGPDGTVYASWLDGRNGRSSTYMTHSVDGGQTWAANTKVSIDESCPCCRTAVEAGQNGLVYVAWRTVLPGNIRDVVVARSTDYGTSWSAPVRVHEDNWEYAGCPHAGPSIRLDPSGALHVLWWTGKSERGGVLYTRSVDSGLTFANPVDIAPQQTPIPTHVQLALSNDGQIIAVWDDLKASPSTILLRVSSDKGATFGQPVIVSADSIAAQHPVIGLRGRVAHVAWSERGNAAKIVMRTVSILHASGDEPLLKY